MDSNNRRRSSCYLAHGYESLGEEEASEGTKPDDTKAEDQEVSSGPKPSILEQQPLQEASETESEEMSTAAEKVRLFRGGNVSASDPQTSYGTLGPLRARGSILRKANQQFAAFEEPLPSRRHRASTTSFSSFGSVDAASLRKRDSSGNFYPTQSRRYKRKPSVISINRSHSSDQGLTRQFTEFEEVVPESPQRKRDSVCSTGSVAGPLLKPSIMAQGEMFSKAQREKQWYMAIHASHPDEVVPVLKKPILLVDEGGNITLKTVKCELEQKNSFSFVHLSIACSVIFLRRMVLSSSGMSYHNFALNILRENSKL